MKDKKDKVKFIPCDEKSQTNYYSRTNIRSRQHQQEETLHQKKEKLMVVKDKKL